MHDLSDFRNDGYIRGATWRATPHGPALDFPASGANEYVGVPHHRSLTGLSEFTLGALVRPNVVAGDRRIAGKWEYTTANREYSLGINGGQVIFIISRDGGWAAITTLTSAGPVSAGVFYDLWAVWDGSTMRIYIDGAADPNTAAETTLYSGTGMFMIGAVGDDTVRVSPFNGIIVWTILLDYALEPWEIKRLHESLR